MRASNMMQSSFGWRLAALLALLCCLSSSRTSADVPEHWTFVGSTLVSSRQGATYIFKMEAPSTAQAQQGVRTGDVMLEIEANGPSLAGLAYSYMTGCDRESYEVSGNLSPDGQSIELNGHRPIRSAACVTQSFEDETVTLSKLAATPAVTPPPPPPLPPQPPSQPRATATPSFDCSGRLSPSEARICSDPGLADLDRQLSLVYKRLRTQLDSAQSLRLRKDQRAWLTLRASCGVDRNCLETAYRLRLSQLANMH
jgi:uncharacterized protein YecT (DUF1311 family)